jgi:hypothetical protein
MQKIGINSSMRSRFGRYVILPFLSLLLIFVCGWIIYWSSMNRLVSQALDLFEETGTYLACGCGCCVGEAPIQECLLYSEKDEIEDIIRNDLSHKWPGWNCSRVGCSRGVEYKYCAEPVYD